MIDIHHHCLPAVDDGPREWDEAVAMCRMAADEGIETIVATPHVLRGRWKNTSRAELDSKLEELRRRVGQSPRLLLGSEYFFAHDVDEVLAAGTSIVPLANSRYVLIELPANNVPPMIEGPLYRMQLAGWVPILAHPERNHVFQARPELLVALIVAGTKTQITAGSFTGEFGSSAKRVAESWLRRRMVHFVATDAHNVTRRPPLAKAARAAVSEIAGEAIADAVMLDNPRAVVENRTLPFEPDPLPMAEGGFFNRLREFFSRQ
ncbi:MAG TPA: CpsB/CapC family capsule biosynthesis tyrosine phosphatase [Thermoanaerobaculia bacterium]|jgi:protein-tyrosine phosphatase